MVSHADVPVFKKKRMSATEFGLRLASLTQYIARYAASGHGDESYKRLSDDVMYELLDVVCNKSTFASALAAVMAIVGHLSVEHTDIFDPLS